MSERDGGPAFPISGIPGRPHDLGYIEGKPGAPGLTKREWFAGMAVMGMCQFGSQLGHQEAHETARRAYGLADAMLRAGLKGGDDAHE